MQTEGRVTHFVAALGTTGTFVGVGRRLREENPRIRLIAVQPDSPYHAIEGVKHLATTELVPGIYDPALPDATLEVSSEEAFEMARCLARTEGLMVGISAAANVVAALRVARRLHQGVVVTILCDGAAKYLSDRFWDEPGVCEGGEGI
jgi:cysteine synthase B